MGRGGHAMTILAFDCAGAACSALLWRDGKVLARRDRKMTHGQAEVLVPMIREAMAAADLGFHQLAAIATTLGPGSFTGLRAGLATARGLALASGLACYGFDTFTAFANATSEAERAGRELLVAIDTRRDDLFVQGFDSELRPRGEATVARVAEAAALVSSVPLLLTGDATADLAQALRAAGRDVILSATAGTIDAAIVARLAAEAMAAGMPPAPVRPLYLRAPDVTPAPARQR